MYVLSKFVILSDPTALEFSFVSVLRKNICIPVNIIYCSLKSNFKKKLFAISVHFLAWHIKYIVRNNYCSS